MKIIVGITGASGSIYAVSLISAMKALGVETSVVMTEMGKKVMEYECGATIKEIAQNMSVYDNTDLFAPIASGSFKNDGMVIVPCSMNTLGSIANGMGDTLLSRAASVTLKEQRRLVAVVREMPLSMIHIENMLKLTKAGGCVMPAAPGFYNRPTQIWELVSGVVGRVLDQFEIDHDINCRWKGGDVECYQI